MKAIKQTELFLEERRQAILNLIDETGRVSVAGLRQRFGVSEVTIRTDLQALSGEGLVVRTHGGAVPAPKKGEGLRELSLAVRRQKQRLEKSRIAQKAASLVNNGQAIILDTSSTALAIAAHLKDRRELTILTNSLMIAVAMLDAPGVTVIMPGGRMRRDSASLVDQTGLDTIRRFNIHQGFFGAHGLTKAEGLTDVSVAEAEMKRPLVAMARQVIIVIDATKWGQVGAVSFAQLEAVDLIITDAEAPAEQVNYLTGRGVEVVLV